MSGARKQRDDICACGRQMVTDWHEYPLYGAEPPHNDAHARYLCPVCDVDTMQDEDDRQAERRRE